MSHICLRHSSAAVFVFPRSEKVHYSFQHAVSSSCWGSSSELMAALQHEVMIRGELLVNSGGGDQYHLVPGLQDRIYKHVKDSRSLAQLLALHASLGGMRRIWAGPEGLLYDASGALSGYVMPKINGGRCLVGRRASLSSSPWQKWSAAWPSEWPPHFEHECTLLWNTQRTCWLVPAF